MLKKLLLIILMASGCVSYAQGEVSVQLSSCRSEYRTHDATNKPGFGVKLELLPSAGVTVFESVSLSTSIVLCDGSGNKTKPTTASIIEENGKTYAKLTFKNRPDGKQVKLEGSLKLPIAKHVTVHDNVKPDLLQASSVQIGGVNFEILPAAGNAANGNREGDRLKRAELQLRYPASVTITQIARQWGAESESTFAQEIDFTTTTSEDQSTKTTSFILVDALPCPTLTISTCTEKLDVEVPVGFNITLSDAVEIQQEPESK